MSAAPRKPKPNQAPNRGPLSDKASRGPIGSHGGGLPDARPPIKIPGGKSALVERLLGLIPPRWAGTYHEPFFGGGALFWALKPTVAYLSDANGPLIKMYREIQFSPVRLTTQLCGPRYRNTERVYYKLRETAFQNAEHTGAEYIYFNKTAWAGVMRFNRSGGFNTPFGHYANPTICDFANIHACSRALKLARVMHADFNCVLKNARKGDVAYLDPPYWPVTATSDFTQYTAGGFGPEDHTRLRDIALELKKRGVCVILSNADVPPVRELYRKGFKIERVEMKRSINSNSAKRGAVGELLIW